MNRARLRNLGITIGSLPTGPANAITDVPGVLVGQVTLKEDQPRVVRTGVTVIMPRDGLIAKDHAFAGFHSFNGCGEMTGILWLEETGLLSSPVGITSTFQIGTVQAAFGEYSLAHRDQGTYLLPVVGETYDGWLSDFSVYPIQKEHVFQALDSVRGGPVDEGEVGGGTGMICYEFKAGIGTSSRVVEAAGAPYTLGALVQANFGRRDLLVVDGVPVGRELGYDRVPKPWEAPPLASSIIVVIATDAPLLADHCKRLAQRATVGIARTGGRGYTSSGDLFLAFATGNHIPTGETGPLALTMLPHDAMNTFFDATVEAVEEAVLNALCAADTTTGQNQRTVEALPLDELQRIWKKYRPG